MLLSQNIQTVIISQHSHQDPFINDLFHDHKSSPSPDIMISPKTYSERQSSPQWNKPLQMTTFWDDNVLRHTITVTDNTQQAPNMPRS